MSTQLYLGNITLQEKDKGDWRAFVNCMNGEVWWELRAYGSTAEEAAKQAYERFQDVKNWEIYGHEVGVYC